MLILLRVTLPCPYENAPVDCPLAVGQTRVLRKELLRRACVDLVLCFGTLVCSLSHSRTGKMCSAEDSHFVVVKLPNTVYRQRL